MWSGFCMGRVIAIWLPGLERRKQGWYARRPSLPNCVSCRPAPVGVWVQVGHVLHSMMWKFGRVAAWGCCHAQARQSQRGKNASPLFGRSLCDGCRAEGRGIRNVPPCLDEGRVLAGSALCSPPCLPTCWHHASCWCWMVVSMAGGFLCLGWERKARPPACLLAHGAGGWLNWDVLPSLCSGLCDAKCCPVKQGQVRILSRSGGLSETYQK